MVNSPHVGASKKACDACKLRKTRCDIPDAQGGSCMRCKRLQLSCTFACGPQRRGPKKRKQGNESLEGRQPSSAEHPVLTFPNALSSPSSITTNPDSQFSHSGLSNLPLVYLNRSRFESSRPLASSIHALSLEVPTVNLADVASCLCSPGLLLVVLDDYLRYIYPLIPIVHRPTFIRDVENNRQLLDKDFSRLLVAMTAVTIALMPSRFHTYRSYSKALHFETRKETLDYCYQLLISYRELEYFDTINYRKWATSYLIGIALFQIGDINRYRMLDVESMQLGRLLHFHKISEYEGLNMIETQLRKKGFWLLFYSYVHSQMQYLRRERLSYLDPELLETLQLRDLLPLNMDDELIFEHSVAPQTTSDAHVASGFVFNSRVFWAALRSLNHTEVPGRRNTCGYLRTGTKSDQETHLRDRLHELKYMLDDVPAELGLWSSSGAQATSKLGTNSMTDVLNSQYAAMRANLHVTHLWLQSILLDQLDALLEGDEMATSPESASGGARGSTWLERDEISRQLLYVLYSIPLQDLEPNGLHLAHKVRDVAVGLLSCPFDTSAPASRRAAQYIKSFTDILSKLDTSERIQTANLQSWIDTDRRERRQIGTNAAEEDLLNWA